MTITPERAIAFATVFNFRDLGGLPTAGGRTVRKGQLFRSDNLGRLGEVDRQAFTALGIRRVIDLRRAGEVASMGRVPDWTRVAWHHHHLHHELWDHSTYSEEIGVARWLADRYADLLTQGAADIAEVIRLVSDVDDGPTVVHCVAGKDRTGLIAALTLSLLDVPDAEIAADYELTQRSEVAFTEWLRHNDPASAKQPPPPFYVQTPALAMMLTLRELRERYGSPHEYLGAHGVSDKHVSALQTGLLEGA